MTPKLTVCLLASVLLCFSHSRAAQPEKGRDTAPEVPEILKTTYTIHGAVLPESLLVRGELEIQYRNLSPSGLRDLYFALPMNFRSPGLTHTLGHTHIDSLLLNGVPQQIEFPSADSSIVHLRFDSPLSADGKAFFLIGFTSRLSNDSSSRKGTDRPRLFSGFYPTVCVHKNWSWILPTSPFDPAVLGEYGQVNVAIAVDSAYTMVGTGLLLNELELFGNLPQVGADTSITDVVAVRAQRRRKNSGPVYKSSQRTYAWGTRKESGFAFVVGKKLTFDRVLWDNRVIDLCYQRTNKKELSTTASKLLAIAQGHRALFGTLPTPKVTILLDQQADTYATTAGLISSSIMTQDANLLWSTLAEPLARCWLPPMISTDSARPSGFNYGIAVYTTLLAARDRFGSRGWQQSPSGLTALDTSKILSADYYSEIVYPAELYILRFCVGERQLANAIRFFVADNRKSFCTIEDFVASLKKATAGEQDWLPSVEAAMATGCDFALDSLSFTPSGSGGSLSYAVRGPRLPVEVAVIAGERDTLYDTLRVLPKDTLTFRHFVQMLPEKPLAVIVDPNQYFPDKDRSNNCLRLDSAACSLSRIPLFPPYRRIVRNDKH